MKKRLIASVTCLCLLLVMLMSSTLAWFTDTEMSHNTMTVGNVSIKQHEKDRYGNDFQQNQNMSPAVPEDLTKPLATENVMINGKEYPLYKNAQKVIDKIVTIENNGSDAAYVRTIFAVEMKKVGTNWLNPVGTEVILYDNKVTTAEGNQTLDFPQDYSSGVPMPMVMYKNADGLYTHIADDAVAAYVIGVYTYDTALAPNDISDPSLLQFYLSGEADSNFFATVGGVYEISVLSQAVQYAGFDQHGAEASLNYVFGDVTAENAAKWFGTGTATPAPTIDPVPMTISFTAYDLFNSGMGTASFEDVELNIYEFDSAKFQGEYPVEDYENWTCDFFVSTNEPLDSGLILVGTYGSYDWLGFWAPESDTPYEPTGLLGTVTNSGESNWTYREICEGVQVFKCGLINTNSNNAGVKATVELRMTSPDKTQTITVRSITATLDTYQPTNP